MGSVPRGLVSGAAIVGAMWCAALVGPSVPGLSQAGRAGARDVPTDGGRAAVGRPTGHESAPGTAGSRGGYGRSRLCRRLRLTAGGRTRCSDSLRHRRCRAAPSTVAAWSSARSCGNPVSPYCRRTTGRRPRSPSASAHPAPERLPQNPDAFPEWCDLPERTGGEGPGRGPRSPAPGRSWNTSRRPGASSSLSSADALRVSLLTEGVLDAGRGTEKGWRSGGISRRRPQGP
jgi:hypothetical protein